MDISWFNEVTGTRPAGMACGEPSIGTSTYACVHEHVSIVPVCAGCAVDLQQAADHLTCPFCAYSEKAEDTHDCYCLVVIDWDSGERTVVQEAGDA
jgi:hypothetical protein